MSIDTDYRVLRAVLAGGMHGWAAEFGVYSGFSLNIIAQHMPVIGFDSFDGLPEDWREGFPMGSFASNDLDIPPHIEQPFNTMLVPGLFEETVPGFPFPPLSLVHIDCDLYSSTVTALMGVRPYISAGTIIVFDEFTGYPGWEDHEAKAWGEFVQINRIIYRTLAEHDQEVAFEITSIGV